MRLFSIFLVLVLLFTATSCGKQPDSSAENTAHGSIEDSTYDNGETFGPYRYEPESTQFITVVENDIYKKVKEVIENANIPQTAQPDKYVDYEANISYLGVPIHFTSKSIVLLEYSMFFPFLEIIGKKSINPFVAFNVLKNNGLIECDNDPSYNYSVFCFEDSDPYNNIHSLPLVTTPESYPFTKDGCEDFVDDVLRLSSCNTNTINIFTHGEYQHEPTVNYSEKDKCYYVYSIFGTTSYAFIAAMYIRSDNSRYISDVEFQIADVMYPSEDGSAGLSVSLALHYDTVYMEVISLFTSIEQLLTGKSFISENNFSNCENYFPAPEKYSVGDYKVSLAYTGFRSVYNNSDCDYGTMYTYRIRK